MADKKDLVIAGPAPFDEEAPELTDVEAARREDALPEGGKSRGAADLAKLQPNKVITQVNGKLVATPAEFYRDLDNAGNSVELTVLSTDGLPSKVTLNLK